ncbi:uncharacterized protein B0H18DRAFT_1002503 [Fomitopsis serialis]|uniref:uncharacterized protein n=1 Tax=Fomitopsis serialis TaxID=139415 RepID=UPI0020082269|nr:uncharacterized protein B0H18DRAFT_1002503 [Neoantrodia serialis]KAH9927564.1 hypothetical protein B0H18DRAFT_1002503 [Neoantrodia serialis]
MPEFVCIRSLPAPRPSELCPVTEKQRSTRCPEPPTYGATSGHDKAYQSSCYHANDRASK